jgi:hypothetical protein
MKAWRGQFKSIAVTHRRLFKAKAAVPVEASLIRLDKAWNKKP